MNTSPKPDFRFHEPNAPSLESVSLGAIKPAGVEIFQPEAPAQGLAEFITHLSQSICASVGIPAELLSSPDEISLSE